MDLLIAISVTWVIDVATNAERGRHYEPFELVRMCIDELMWQSDGPLFVICRGYRENTTTVSLVQTTVGSDVSDEARGSRTELKS